MHKQCTKCLTEKSLTEFGRDRAQRDGYSYICKKCRNEALRKLRERGNTRQSERTRRWRAKADRGQVAASRKARYERRKDEIAEVAREYRQRNVGARRCWTAAYRAARSEASPQWLTPADRQAIRAVYEEARRIEEATGVKMHVDHIIPLRGKAVRGLHVPWNLQVLSATANMEKGTKIHA